MKKCTIIILNWNGRDLLAQGLPSVIGALEAAGGGHEILVVDNGSTDGSVDFVKSSFPRVNVLALEKNYGFGEGNTRGVRQASGEVAVLLNNDMVVEKDFLPPLLLPFESDDSLFAVGCQIFFQDKERRREETGKTFAYWDHGTIRYLHQDVTALDYERKYVPVFWASGGAAAYSKKKFLELGGFRSLFNPAYVEDTDVSYRAWKRGWKVLFAPQSVVYHKHRASSGKRFDLLALEILVRRNQLLFIWCNISSWRMLMEHFFMLPLRLLKYTLRDKDRIDWRAFSDAFSKIVGALRLNLRERAFAKRRDDELLAGFEWKRDLLRSQKRLSILFVCPYVPCLGIHAGGARMYQIIKGLSARHDVSVLTYMEVEKEKELAAELEKFCKKVTTILRGQSFDEPDWFHINPHRPVKEFANPQMKEAITQEMLSGKYDLVQFEYLEMGYLARDMRKYNVLLVLTNHEVQSRTIMQSLKEDVHTFDEKIQLFYEWMVMLNFELRTAKLFDLVITLTETEKKALVAYDARLPIMAHATGVDLPYFAAAERVPVEPHSMVFVGYYRHYPNTDAMHYFCSEIFPAIRAKYADVKLYIVGAEPTQSLQKLHDGASVVVTGRVADIRPYIARSSVYVVPMRLGAGIRGKIMEAWAMRKPVVSTLIAASGLEIEPGINIVIAERSEEFAMEVMKLFEEDDRRLSIGEAGYRTAVGHYGWPAQVAKQEAMYHELLNTVH